MGNANKKCFEHKFFLPPFQTPTYNIRALDILIGCVIYSNKMAVWYSIYGNDINFYKKTMFFYVLYQFLIINKRIKYIDLYVI
jgi:hypothetical protein